MNKKKYVKPITELIKVDGNQLCVHYGQMYMCSPGGYYYGGDIVGDNNDSRQ